LLLDVGDIHVWPSVVAPAVSTCFCGRILDSVERFEEISLFEKVINRSKLKTSLRQT
jgi:hypothetical protein